MKRLSILFICALSSSALYAADGVVNSATQNTLVQNTQPMSPITGTAKEWNLSESEWTKYISLMSGSAGKYYTHLSPPEVLGHYAESNDDLRHFAELYARQEHEKLEREARFDRAFNEAVMKLYGNEPIIKQFDMSSYTPLTNKSVAMQAGLQSGDHVVLFIDIKKYATYAELSNLIVKIKNASAMLDIYCLSAEDNGAIQAWAGANHVPVDLVAANRITLNHEMGQHQNILTSMQSPYLMLVRNGQSKTIDVGAL